jgi:hypothetical protein
MDNRDRDKDLNSNKPSSSSSDPDITWDNEPSRNKSGGMQGDKGRSSNIESEREDRDVNRGSKELEH